MWSFGIRSPKYAAGSQNKGHPITQQCADRRNGNVFRKTPSLVWYFPTCCSCARCICNCFTQRSVRMKFISNQSISHIHSSYLHLLRLIDLTTFSCSHQGALAWQPVGGVAAANVIHAPKMCVSFIFRFYKTDSTFITFAWYKKHQQVALCLTRAFVFCVSTCNF